MYFISVIIPCFNVELYIEETINSVLSQNIESPFEIILIDDSSIDNTFNILKSYESKYFNIKVIKNEVNKGVSYSRNVGINFAEGEFVFFLDGDDVYKPLIFKSIFDVYLENSKIDLFAFSFNKEMENSIQTFSNPKYNLHLFNQYDFLNLYLKRKLYQCMCSFAIKRDILIKNNILFSEDLFSGEDQEFQMKCYLNSDLIFYFSYDFFVYKYRKDSFMNSPFSIKRITSLEVYSRISKEISKKNISNEIQHLYNLFSAYEFLSVLKNALNNSNFLEKILFYDSILNKKIKFQFTPQFFVVYILKNIYKISPSLVFSFFKILK